MLVIKTSTENEMTVTTSKPFCYFTPLPRCELSKFSYDLFANIIDRCPPRPSLDLRGSEPQRFLTTRTFGATHHVTFHWSRNLPGLCCLWCWRFGVLNSCWNRLGFVFSTIFTRLRLEFWGYPFVTTFYLGDVLLLAFPKGLKGDYFSFLSGFLRKSKIAKSDQFFRWAWDESKCQF